jgi:hypothetical protein
VRDRRKLTTAKRKRCKGCPPRDPNCHEELCRRKRVRGSERKGRPVLYIQVGNLFAPKTGSPPHAHGVYDVRGGVTVTLPWFPYSPQVHDDVDLCRAQSTARLESASPSNVPAVEIITSTSCRQRGPRSADRLRVNQTSPSGGRCPGVPRPASPRQRAAQRLLPLVDPRCVRAWRRRPRPPWRQGRLQ